MNLNKLIPTIFIVLFFASCSNKNSLNLSETNCRDEVPVLGNLSFVFDKNLAPDSALNRWTDFKYIEFKPAIAGKFQWKNPNELIFSPEKELLPATEFTAVFTKELIKETKYKMGDLDDIIFHTPYLTLTSTNGAWVNKEALSATIIPEITLNFNCTVNPAELSEILSLKRGSEKLDYKISSEEKGQFVTLRINNLKPEDKDLTLILEIEKGLKPAHGLTGNNKKIEAEIFLPSPFNLIIANQEAEHDGITGTVKLISSQKIASDIVLVNYISIEPEVNFKAAISDEGIFITSDGFDLTKTYEISVKRGLKGSVGGTLKEDYTNSIVFGKLEPSISFMDAKGVYLASKGNRNLEIKINNVEKVKVTISKIYENNLLNARKNGYYPGGGYDEYYEEEGESSNGYYGSDYEYEVGDIVFEKEYNTKNLPKKGSSRLLHFDFPDALKDFKGIYHVRIASESEYYLRDAKFVSLSDLGLISHLGKTKAYVFVNSISGATAISGVNLTLYGNNNQKIGSAISNADGYAEIPLINKTMAGFKPAMVVAKNGSDFNYLPFNSTMVETSRFDVGGVRNNSTGLRAFVYGDRDIYRPGEKVNFSAIVRNQQWQTPGNIPLKMKVLLPNGKELKTLKKSLNEQGSVESFVELSPAAVSGHYTIEIYSSNDILLATKSIMVEEFMPDRIKVKAVLNKSFYRPGDSMRININAVNFFGPPAANRNYECAIQIKEKTFDSKNFPKYNFSLSNTDAYYENSTLEGTTDANGNASKSEFIPTHFGDRGILQASFYTTVFDETGRPVSKVTNTDIITQDVFYGIQNTGYGYYQLNQPIAFNLVAVNKDDRPFANAKAKILVIKNEYKTVLSRSGDYFRYESQLQKKTIEDKEINLSGANTIYRFVPRSPGDYEIRIARPGSNTFVSTSFYSYGWWGEYGSGFQVNREGNIDIETDRITYETGSLARILFKTPFNGKMLVTLESDEVLEYHYVEVKNRTASLSLNLSEKSIPNVYVSATLIKPHGESDMPLTVAHGYKSVNVEQASRKIPVKIIAAKSARSRSKQKVTVKARPGCKVTLAAVDEGILQLTNYQTPDPHAFFYTKKALMVDAFDLYPLLLPEIKNSISFTGGDGYNLSKRVNPLPNKRVKLVATWSGITDANSGEVSFDVDIPQFSGEIRLMAVAYKDENFGSAEEKIRVADPIVISTSLPRFLSPGDTVQVPITITNTTEKAASGTVRIQIAGPLKIFGTQNATINLKPNAETQVIYKIVAESKISACKVSVEVSAVGEKFVEDLDITIRPTTSVQKRVQSGSINAGSSKNVSLLPGGFIPTSVVQRLILSKSPIIEFADQLDYLVQYPYGCTEQTISAAFPQLYYGDLADLMNLKETNKAAANYNVQEAIRKIKMRQLYNGAVTLWDNEGSENWWTTAYAAHFLIEAKKAGFESDASLTDKMLEFLSARVKNRDAIIYRYNRTESKQIAPKEVAYSLFVLSLAGKPDVGTMNYYKQNPHLMALDCKYLLSAAFALSGDKTKSAAMMPNSFTGEISVKESGGSFYSDVRDESIALYALLQIDPNNLQINTMASHVSAAFKTRKYLSTQERSFGLLALGKLARENIRSVISVSVKVDGKQIASGDGKTLLLTSKQLNGKEVEITTIGKGKLYYSLISEGISATGDFKEEDNFIRVRKQFYDRYGKALTSNTFRQNDMIIVGISIDNAYSSSIENIVITDMLPAGFEIENPRIKEIPGMNWIKNDNYPSHSDIRDDRINLFINLTSARQTYYYAVRAVSSGWYKMGPVMADAMYNGEIHSYNGAGSIRILSK